MLKDFNERKMMYIFELLQEWMTKEHVKHQFQVNFVGVVESIRTFLPLLKSGRGKYIQRRYFSVEYLKKKCND